ncbi:MAG: cupin domain-containing protein [Chloroflexota bacterium]|nr:cupin domain-containing protein [Chloroflexota bacterium]
MTLEGTRRPVARSGDEGEALAVLGGLYTYKAVNAETGAYFACEVKARQGFAIPVHYHEEEEEGFYVAQGEVTIFLGDEARRLGPGGFALAPRGTSHAFRYETGDAVLLLLLSPGPKHEALFREMGEPAAEHAVPAPPSTPPDPEKLGVVAARHGTRIIGPPPVE